LMSPTRPRGMTRVTATFTHTAATIKPPRTAPAIRTSLMLNAGVGAGPIAGEPCPRLLVAPQDTAQPALAC
jgi:hypothetical protein